MNTENKNKVLQPVIVDMIWGVVYFPIWWYSKGLIRAFRFCFGKIAEYWKLRGFAISIKFLFRPMYLQNDFWGRIISFFIRLFVLIFKLVLFLLVSIIFISVFLLWTLLPIIAIYKIYINIIKV